MSFNIYDFSSFTQSIHEGLSGVMSSSMVTITEMVIVGLVFLIFYAVIGLVLVYAERKVCGFIQNRVGPNRVGPYGIIQTIADFIKLLFKELLMVQKADKFLFNLAPFIVIISSLLALGMLPFAKRCFLVPCMSRVAARVPSCLLLIIFPSRIPLVSM